jgi:hypothetical protein
MSPPPSGKTVLVVLLFLGGVLFVGAAPAYACSCAGQSPADAIAGGDAAFVGTYLGRTEPPPAPVVSSGDLVVNHFSVERAVKGDIGGNLDVGGARDGATCGLELAAGQRTGLVIRQAGDRWESNLCLQIEPAALLAAAQPPPPNPAPLPVRPAPPAVVTPPAPSPSATPSPSGKPSPSPTPSDPGDLAAGERSGSPLLPILLVAGVVAAGLAIALKLRADR